MADNLDPAPGNQDPAVDTAGAPAPAPVTPPAPAPSVAWKNHLRTDLRDSPLSQKFPDTADGLNGIVESYANLEKLLGHEKVPIPKGPDDKEGWSRFSKALGIPDRPDGYRIPDLNLPEPLKGKLMSKADFSQIAAQQRLTPTQAEGLWKVYHEANVKAYNGMVEKQKQLVADNINKLRQDWGDAYDTNVELGQMVINKFSDDQEMNDYITAALSQDPRGIKFLAKIGDQFAENKMGDFQLKRFTRTPEEALAEIDKILRDPNHPYINPKATSKEHEEAVEYVNRLYAIANKKQGQA